MHSLRIALVKVGHIYGDPLPEICLKAVHSHIQKPAELALIPPAGIRIGKVNQPHPRLPVVGLADSLPVCTHQQKALFCRFPEKSAPLGNVRIDPDADFQPSLVIAPKHPFRIRENPLVPLKIAPVKALHPETVEMKNA